MGERSETHHPTPVAAARHRRCCQRISSPPNRMTNTASWRKRYGDDDQRVKGMERLRVIDAPIMPTVVSGDTDATADMSLRAAENRLIRAGPASIPAGNDKNM